MFFLVKFVGVRIFVNWVIGLDLEKNYIFFVECFFVSFDLFFIDIGSIFVSLNILGVIEYVIVFKFILKFIVFWY